jgi:hypothetical protein
VHAADAVVDDAHVARQGVFGREVSSDLRPEAVVAEEQVADAGDQDRRAQVSASALQVRGLGVDGLLRIDSGVVVLICVSGGSVGRAAVGPF